MRTLYVAWKDVIENPRPDGVPSKTLQKEEFKKWEESGEKTTDLTQAKATA